jgi:hypothetical protein
MRWLFFVVILSGCKLNAHSNTQTDPLNLTGDTGRNLILEISGIDTTKSKSSSTQVCAFGLAGTDPSKREIIEKRLVCTEQVDVKTGTATIELKHLPYPAYIQVFHDENNNRVLDFGTFNILIAKKHGPMEGLGQFVDPDDSFEFSRPIWAEVGSSSTQWQMRYRPTPIWQFIHDRAWNYVYNWYLEKAHEINHEGKPKNPFCQKAEDCL